MFYRQKCTYDEEQQQRLLEYWKDVLGLQIWDIKAHIVRKGQMTDDSQGIVEYRHANFEATIRQIDPIDWGNRDFEQDMETSLVHELLHLILLPLTEEKGETLAEEQTVNIIARALVGLKRQSQMK